MYICKNLYNKSLYSKNHFRKQKVWVVGGMRGWLVKGDGIYAEIRDIGGGKGRTYVSFLSFSLSISLSLSCTL